MEEKKLKVIDYGCDGHDGYDLAESEEDLYESLINDCDYGHCGDTLSCYELSEDEIIDCLKEADEELYDCMLGGDSEMIELANKYFNRELYNERKERYRKMIYGDDK